MIILIKYFFKKKFALKTGVFFSILPTFFKWDKIGQKYSYMHAAYSVGYELIA